MILRWCADGLSTLFDSHPVRGDCRGVHRPQAIQAAAVERRRPAGVLLPQLSRPGAGLVSSVDATGTRGARSARGRGVQPQHRHAVRAVPGRGAGTAHRSRGRLAARFRLAPPVTRGPVRTMLRRRRLMRWSVRTRARLIPTLRQVVDHTLYLVDGDDPIEVVDCSLV
jgi:hypothetical protein